MLRFVGDGPDRQTLQDGVWSKRLVDNVVLEGAVGQDRIRELYATADLFVLPSFAEGVPVVLMEAMAQEIACLSTGITGHPELIRDGVDGLLVPPSDVDGMYNAVCRLMDDAELRRRLGQDGRQRVLSAYHLDHNMRAMADQIQKRLEDL